MNKYEIKNKEQNFIEDIKQHSPKEILISTSIKEAQTIIIKISEHCLMNSLFYFKDYNNLSEYEQLLLQSLGFSPTTE